MYLGQHYLVSISTRVKHFHLNVGMVVPKIIYRNKVMAWNNNKMYNPFSNYHHVACMCMSGFNGE